ncbi:hypothetical protein PAXRUDRAFT_551086 [Paxillus rubicundulus Ve08.2h10]|uniref:Uncharacterized protein n=1 Tax=Paxillus rubicundulus Ve08.2h10 TaxID=930991 RepID=A0A0D0DAR8_9AGAM|nr:hypothetical protein PAXRUDRAFT_551086 [Paxillus rubicundulus Ve08.2h10]
MKPETEQRGLWPITQQFGVFMLASSSVVMVKELMRIENEESEAESRDKFEGWDRWC